MIQSICLFWLLKPNIRRRQWHPTPVLLPWTEEPGGLQSMRSLRVGHDWVTSLSLFTFMHWRRKWQPTPVFLPGESQGRGSLVVCRLWGRIESDTTEAMQQQQQQILYLLWCFSWGISLVFVLGKVFFFSKSAWLISVTFGGGVPSAILAKNSDKIYTQWGGEGKK